MHGPEFMHTASSKLQ